MALRSCCLACGKRLTRAIVAYPTSVTYLWPCRNGDGFDGERGPQYWCVVKPELCTWLARNTKTDVPGGAAGTPYVMEQVNRVRPATKSLISSLVHSQCPLWARMQHRLTNPHHSLHHNRYLTVIGNKPSAQVLVWDWEFHV